MDNSKVNKQTENSGIEEKFKRQENFSLDRVTQKGKEVVKTESKTEKKE